MIFYFSGTGNTRWAARRLAEATGEQLRFMPDELHTPAEYSLLPGERLGFCFPVHGWQPPRLVRTFVSKARFRFPPVATPYVYALCTCGDSTGRAMAMFAALLKEKGLKVQACQSLIMPESYVCLPFMYTDTAERELQKKEQAAATLRPFTEVVARRQEDYSQLTPGPAPWVLSHVVGAYFNRHMVSDRKFTADAALCTHCGRCAKVCPVGDIDFDGIPRWRHDGSCTSCLSCYHHCPVHAINYGSITRRRGQYYFEKNNMRKASI